MNNIFECRICNKEFKSQAALSGHSRMHGESEGKNKIQMVFCEELNEYVLPRTLIKLAEYNINPKLCKQCNTPIEYSQKNIKNFCSHSCSATFTNKLRDPMSTEQKYKIFTTLRKTRAGDEHYDIITLEEFIEMGPSRNRKKQSYQRKKKIIKVSKAAKDVVVDGPSTRIFHRVCKHCNIKFISRSIVLYCDDCSGLYKQNNRYKFTFNVFDYPELFDLNLVEKYGWHSYGGRFDYNPTGITRDHRVSVNEAIKNNYDPFYIKHPLNCELMSFVDNNKKKTKSSIIYKELVKLIDDYEFNKKSLETESLGISIASLD